MMDLQPGKPLPSEALYRRCDPGQLKFESTESIGDGIEIPGQDRAIEAIHYATDMDLHGYNVFVLGTPGSGRHSLVSHFLESRAAQQPAPSDWCSVNIMG